MKLPEPVHTHTTADAIIKWYEKQTDDPRPHLGASEIGKPCDRALWYSFHWSTKKQFEGRMKRLFNRGHREEAHFIEELRAIGIEVHEVDPETKQQFKFTAHGGHFGGSCDGVARGLPEAPKTWAILEFKTHNLKSFKELVSKGVEEAKPEHYAQMQVYMGLSELERAMYLAVCKDDDTLYAQWIHFDKEKFDILMQRAESIIAAEEPPQGISTDPSWYQCKFCDHQDLCHGQIAAQKNCRTCVHSAPGADAQWMCDHFKRPLSVAEQRIGCRAHLMLPSLVPYAEPIDAGEDFIKYQHKDNGLIFANCTEDADRGEENMGTDIVSCFTSAELAVAIRDVVSDKEHADIRAAFPGSRLVGSGKVGAEP